MAPLVVDVAEIWVVSRHATQFPYLQEAVRSSSFNPFVLRPDQHERALNVVGTQVTVLVSNAATQSYGITFAAGLRKEQAHHRIVTIGRKRSTS